MGIIFYTIYIYASCKHEQFKEVWLGLESTYKCRAMTVELGYPMERENGKGKAKYFREIFFQVTRNYDI